MSIVYMGHFPTDRNFGRLFQKKIPGADQTILGSTRYNWNITIEEIILLCQVLSLKGFKNVKKSAKVHVLGKLTHVSPVAQA